MRTLLVAPTRQNPVLDKLAALLRARRGCEDIECVTFDRAEMRLRSATFELVFVLVADESAGNVLETVRVLHEAGTRVLVVGPARDPKLILGVMQAGAERFLDEDELEADLDAVLTRLYPRTGTETRQMLAVLSASGGCGASTIAVNLAVLLAGVHGRCNLIDLNTNKADLAPLLDLKPQYTLTDLCVNEGRLDPTMYEKLLTPHSSGTALLAGPRFHEEAEGLTTNGVAQAVSFARETFAHVVVDLEDHFHDEQTAVLEQATRILLVCRLEFTSVRNARRIIDYVVARGVPRERIEIVINHAGLPNELPIKDAEIALGGSISHLLPHAPETVYWSTNTGIPAAIKDPKSAIAQSIARLVGLDTPAPPQPGFFARAGAFCQTGVLPWFRSIRGTAQQSATVQIPPQSAVDTKVCHESIPAAKPTADTRACTV